MNKDLKLEVFATTGAIPNVGLHMYKLIADDVEGNPFRIIRSACWKVRNVCNCGVFENGINIFTTEKINVEIPNAKFKIEYVGFEILDVQQNKKVYQDLMKYYICEKLKLVTIANKYRKYSCKSDITSKWILTKNGFQTVSSDDKKISLERKYNIRVEIKENGKGYLWLDTSSIFSSNDTIADLLRENIEIVGMPVKNDWAKNHQSGVINEVASMTVSDELSFGTSLKDYYVKIKKEGYRVEKIPDSTPVINVLLNNGGEISCYPHALKPIYNRENIRLFAPAFSMRIENYVKRSMAERMELNIDFIHDIGTLPQLNNIGFETHCCCLEEIGFKKGMVQSPELICGNNHVLQCNNKLMAFKYGFYKNTPHRLKIGYLYPKNMRDLMAAVANDLVSFCSYGKYNGEKSKYLCEKLLSVQASAIVQEEYELGDITGYKRSALKLSKEDVDIVLVIVPDNLDDDGPYNPFKKIWAENGIPSQMISVSTAMLFVNNQGAGEQLRYFLTNIVLGILGKTGGIPWIIKDMPGDVDCFVGLDVATAEKGIHFPACSVVFDKNGRLLEYYKTQYVQKGEKITEFILQDIFDHIILAYEEKFGVKPKKIVIHRDGFSNESDEWYQKYFSGNQIKYSIIEVRKNINTKVLYEEEQNILNPLIGHCVYNEKRAYLITTDIGKKRGTPNPILIEKSCGDLSMAIILTQILYLSQLHVGSIQKTRLPITTDYADKICKNKDYIPEGKLDNRLFFL